MQTLSRSTAATGKGHHLHPRLRERAEEILAAFKTYYETAELEGVTDPNLVFDLRAKLDAQGFYDDNEVKRVVNVELDPRSTQKDLAAAIAPVADRLLRRYKELQKVMKAAQPSKTTR